MSLARLQARNWACLLLRAATPHASGPGRALALALEHLEPQAARGAPWSAAGRGFASRAVEQEVSAEDVAAMRRKVLVNRVLYRSKQRGFLELDLLVGIWARDHAPSMAEAELLAFQQVLDEENPDLFRWLTGQEEPPARLQANPAYQALHESVGRQLAACRAPAAKSAPGKAWVRGYEDWGKPAEKAGAVS